MKGVGALGSLKYKGLGKEMGTTYGNFIRRTLMLRLGSYEVIGVRINGGVVKTIFDMIPNVPQDVLEICYRLGEVKWIGEGQNEDGIIKVRGVSKGGVMLAENLTSDVVKVANPEHKICDVVGEKEIEIEVFVKWGVGVTSSQDNELILNEGGEENVIGLKSFHKGYDKIWLEMEGEDLTVRFTGCDKKRVKEVISNEIMNLAGIISKM